MCDQRVRTIRQNHSSALERLINIIIIIIWMQQVLISLQSTSSDADVTARWTVCTIIGMQQVIKNWNPQAVIQMWVQICGCGWESKKQNAVGVDVC